MSSLIQSSGEAVLRRLVSQKLEFSFLTQMQESKWLTKATIVVAAALCALASICSNTTTVETDAVQTDERVRTVMLTATAMFYSVYGHLFFF